MRRRQGYRGYRNYQFADSDNCPNCGRLKNAGFAACYMCSRTIPEYSESWEKGDAGVDLFYVYILRLSNHRYYVGQTRDLARRVREHEEGGEHAAAAVRGKNPELVWFNTVATRGEATQLELQLKHTRAAELTDMIRNFNKAIRGGLPSFALRADLSAHQAEMRAGMLRLRRMVIATGIVLAVLIVILRFWFHLGLGVP